MKRDWAELFRFRELITHSGPGMTDKFDKKRRDWADFVTIVAAQCDF